MLMTLEKLQNFTYYAGIMLDALPSYYAQNYAGIIGSSLLHVHSSITSIPSEPSLSSLNSSE